MQKCPICMALDTYIVHHYYNKDLHKTNKVYKCRNCGNEWNEEVI